MPLKRPHELRPVSIELDVNRYAEGSALIAAGNTRVICTASVTSDVPPWMRGKGTGWITAEYGMLPRSTHTRKPRDASRGRTDARALEIQRLIGRSLRQAVDMRKIGERTIYIDCDVLEADGGTRTASITGGMVALAQALAWLKREKGVMETTLRRFVAAVSVGIVSGQPTLDLCYEEDANADVDMNVVMDDEGRFIEIQGTAEHDPFSRDALGELLDLAAKGVDTLLGEQKKALGAARLGEIAGA